ncbi:hypothetical protein C8R44DRAFT_725221 [Mycena epipterygia]|nr:hypothetical protein C8R44DRAFT_725221 [Mycena epipterygia]
MDMEPIVVLRTGMGTDSIAGGVSMPFTLRIAPRRRKVGAAAMVLSRNAAQWTNCEEDREDVVIILLFMGMFASRDAGVASSVAGEPELRGYWMCILPGWSLQTDECYQRYNHANGIRVTDYVAVDPFIFAAPTPSSPAPTPLVLSAQRAGAAARAIE